MPDPRHDPPLLRHDPAFGRELRAYHCLSDEPTIISFPRPHMPAQEPPSRLILWILGAVLVVLALAIGVGVGRCAG